MGNLCNCTERSGTGSAATLPDTPFHLRDPRLIDISTHLKILDSKLNSNLTLIDDFIQLLTES